MPFRSKSQERLFAAKMRRGEITRAKFDEWAHSTPDISALPERLKPRPEARPRRAKRKSH